MKAREIMKKENAKIREKKQAKKEEIKARRMLGDEDEGEKKHRHHHRKAAEESESDNEDFSSEEETLRNTNVGDSNQILTTNTNTFATFTTTTENLNTHTDNAPGHEGEEEVNPYQEATEQEKTTLDKLLAREATHWQWDKHAVCFTLLISNVLVSLMRGSKKSGSIIGIKPCDVIGWLLVAAYIVICSALTFSGVKKVNAE